jgi:hypothetical protein
MGNDARTQHKAVRRGGLLAIAGGLLFTAGTMTGCNSAAPRTSGADMVFLTAPLNTLTAETPQTNLLPLTPGNRWQMRTVTRGKRFMDAITVAGPVRAGKTEAVALSMTREGKPWRREFYVPSPDGVYLAAMQDETSPLMVLDPPIPLARSPFQEGQAWQWRGTLTMNGKALPAAAFSRVSTRESVTTSAGQFKTYRVDTIVKLDTGEGREVRFPSARWLAPGVGFVRRGFADKGKPAFSELLEFNVR